MSVTLFCLLTFLPQMISSTSITNTRGNKSYSVYFCLSERLIGYLKMVSLPVVLLIFITSNYPQGKLNEGILEPPTEQTEKGFVDNGKSPKDSRSQINDLTNVDFRFPDNHEGKTTADKKIIREKLIPDDKSEKNKAPVPLYSLVKNDCGEGYALDENGVCQKTITVRSGKKFDSEKRRKRSILDYDWITQKKKNSNRNAVEDDFRKTTKKCSELYPGMVPDGKGDCMKTVKSLDQPFDKTLPP